MKRALRKFIAECRNLSFAAIILGSVLNMLEAVSLGLLIFPPAKHNDAFTGLEIQGVSMFIMSTLISQITLSLGGTSLSPALSSMLAELLPFFRNIASTVQKELGTRHPGVLPTTMAAFAMASIILGFLFLLLAVFRCGNLVGYFPQTVMTGVIGAVGVSLIVFALEVTFPAPSPHLTPKNLFSLKHLPLLAASVLPALFMSTLGHVKSLGKHTNLFSSHPLYVPVCCLAIAAVFWATVAGSDKLNAEALASSGWLFKTRPLQHNTSAASWNYWALFDFAKVEWGVFSRISSDIASLVLFGAFTLPIFVSAAAIDLEEFDHSMNHDFFGHGLVNVFVGLAGTLPATTIYSNTRLFHSAQGKRYEAIIVALIGLSFFFSSSYVLPYVPTILASALVLYIGMELVIESLWQSSGFMLWNEWIVVASTTLGSSFLGFAQGVGIGLAISVLLYFLRDLFTPQLRFITPCVFTHDEIRRQQQHSPIDESSLTHGSNSHSREYELPIWDHDHAVISFQQQLLPPIVSFKNRVEFADKPAITSHIERVLAMDIPFTSYFVLDFERVISIDSCVAKYLMQQVSRLIQRRPHTHLIVIGAKPGSEISTRLAHGGLRSTLNLQFDSVEQFLRTCRYTGPKVGEVISRASQNLESAVDGALARVTSACANSILTRLKAHLPAIIRHRLAIWELSPRQAIACQQYTIKPIFLVLHGEVTIREPHDLPEESFLSEPLRRACAKGLTKAFFWFCRTVRREKKSRAVDGRSSKRLMSSDIYDANMQSYTCAHAGTKSCWILEANPDDIASVTALKYIASSWRAQLEKRDVQFGNYATHQDEGQL